MFGDFFGGLIYVTVTSCPVPNLTGMPLRNCGEEIDYRWKHFQEGVRVVNGIVCYVIIHIA